MTVENLLPPGRHPGIEVSVEPGLAQYVTKKKACKGKKACLKKVNKAQLAANKKCQKTGKAPVTPKPKPKPKPKG